MSRSFHYLRSRCHILSALRANRATRLRLLRSSSPNPAAVRDHSRSIRDHQLALARLRRDEVPAYRPGA